MRINIQISGTVQGVGFRHFVYNLAVGMGLSGWVKNSLGGVEIEVEGAKTEAFTKMIRASPPPLAVIKHFTVKNIQPHTEPSTTFEIEPSSTAQAACATEITPDISTCADCLNELFDPKDRRYLYPFINCTNCGPRYSIIKDLPYDRVRTTMAPFTMCARCEEEFSNPANRRYHAQPNGCEECGPKTWVYRAESGSMEAQEQRQSRNYKAVKEVQAAIEEGKIVAIKGIGGFHLACNAADTVAVQRLRAFKKVSFRTGERSNRPFALMVSNIESAKELAVVGAEEELVLCCASSPILLLDKSAELPYEVAPGSRTYGIMLPYTPLHHLLFFETGKKLTTLVMTSANNNDEPIVTGNAEAIERLGSIADLFLFHDRVIEHRVDDSIVQLVKAKTQVLRRARGMSPFTLELKNRFPGAVAFGAQQKNTFCIGKESTVTLSPHVGELNTERALSFQASTLKNMLKLYDIRPTIVAHDSHPDYTSTRRALEYAKVNSIPHKRVFAIQHHHAHIASCMAEHGLTETVIGVAFDGTGAGDDGNIWGGEFFTADRSSYKRAAHFKYTAMPGGDQAVKEPWRMGLAYLKEAYKEQACAVAEETLKSIKKNDREVILKMLEQRVNSALTSSVGRLFDAVASIIGLRDYVTYEGEAAVELEAVTAGAYKEYAENLALKPYGYSITEASPCVVDVYSAIISIVEEVTKGTDVSKISLKFHITISSIITDICRRIKSETGITDVVLSGGVFQNRLLCSLAGEQLKRAGFTPYFNYKVPTNDGGIALGQIVIATERFLKESDKKGK